MDNESANKRTEIIERRAWRYQNADRKFKCDVCNWRFRDAAKFQKHNRNKLKKPMTCRKCNKIFCHTLTFMKHLYSCENTQAENLEQKNDTVYTDLRIDDEEMVTHKKKDHKSKPKGPKIKKHKCDVCSVLFSSKEKLKKHQSAKTREIVKCKLCNTIFCNTVTYYRHRYECEKSNAKKSDQLEYPQDYIQPKIQHPPKSKTKSIYKNYKCKVCDMAFLDGSKLRRHQSTKSKEPIKCKTCSTIFCNKLTYKRHLQRCKDAHATGSTESIQKQYQRDENFQTDPASINKISERQSCYPIPESSSVKRSTSTTYEEASIQSCPFCVDVFETREICERHIKMHGKELQTKEHESINNNHITGNHECCICGYRSTQREAVRLHMEFFHYTEYEN